MTKHTPGPWRVGVDHHGTIAVMWSHGYVVDDIACGEVGEPRSLADAHLIAAAPDMLEALEVLAVILRSPTQRDDDGNVVVHGLRAALINAETAIAKAKGTP